MLLSKFIPFVFAFYATSSLAEMPPIGAAPEGNATKVASKVIKYNFPSCKSVSNAKRLSDGSIKASCDGVEYLVFTMFSKQKGKVINLALNCEAARQINVFC